MAGSMRSTAIALIGTIVVCACENAHPPPSEGDRRARYERADHSFASAVLLKPQPGFAEGAAFDLAPLLMVEARPDESSSPFSPFVRVQRGSVTIGAESYDQWVYSWWFPEAGAPGRIAQGVRMTLGRDGFPALYEVLADSSGLKPVFVTTELEAAAAAAHGDPLEGRRFSVEHEVGAAVVPGVVEPGPMPLGPFVYLTRDEHDVATLICRCMPSQVDEIVDTREYELRLATADDAQLGWPETNALALESALRLPPSGL